jgi:hypothetical protein
MISNIWKNLQAIGYRNIKEFDNKLYGIIEEDGVSKVRTNITTTGYGTSNDFKKLEDALSFLKKITTEPEIINSYMGYTT